MNINVPVSGKHMSSKTANLLDEVENFFYKKDIEQGEER